VDGARVFAVVLPLGPLRVGERIDRTAWPPHVTLVADVQSSGGFDVVLAVVREAARRIPVQVTTVQEEAWFGPDGDVLVDLVAPDGLQQAHEVLLGALEAHAGVRPVVPAFHRDGYRPHVTASPVGRPRLGERLTLATAALVEIGPDGRSHLAVPVAVFDLARAGAPVVPPLLDAGSALELCGALAEARIRHWVIGGWGVDALLGEQTREHHDLDLFVHVDDLAPLPALLAGVGMTVRYVWSENRWLDGDGLPSAFVSDGPLGELDVHVVAMDGDRPVPLSESSVTLPRGALAAIGTIAGTPVGCATVEAQLLMHRGYELPAHHRDDVERLRSLGRR
jgi:lincosamide nucleotidyltransferase A/C/D/E